jgi:hypothetical protein
MNIASLALATGLAILLGACGNTGSSQCGSDEARQLVDELIKEELGFGIQNKLDSQVELGSYDTAELDAAIGRLTIALGDVRTSRDDPDSSRLSCRATISLTIPQQVEARANEARSMAESGTVRELANVYKMKREGGNYTSDFDYFIQPTDDGEKLFAEVDSEAPPLAFLSEVFVSFLLRDQVREEKIAQDQEDAARRAEELAAERAQQELEREIDAASQAEADAALNSARVERELASDRINAVWNSMPRAAQLDLDALHGAWVREMNARCQVEAAGTDSRREMRQARELNCQSRYVRSCATSLNRNVGNTSGSWTYCRF